MKQPSFIGTLESQREYVKAVQCGYGYTRQGNAAHYLFRADQVEPSILATLEPAPLYIWSFVGCTMESAAERGVQPTITPLHDGADWTKRTPKL